jgi:hypothetical protein
MPTAGQNFIAHQGAEAWDLLDSFVRETQEPDGSRRLGATVFIPRRKLSYCRDRVASLREAATYVIADPETSRLLLPYEDRGSGREDYAYLAESDPLANRARFVSNVLRAQLAVGADILVSPWLPYAGIREELEGLVDLATRAFEHPLHADRTILLSFEVAWNVLADDALRDVLINELVDLPDAPLYLRVQILAPQGRKQYENRAALGGLRTLIEALGNNERTVLLPQVGLMGWLMLPSGALAFGAGISASLQRSTAPGGGGGFGTPPLNWYFLPQFLGFVLAEELRQLRRVDGFEACPCPYCEASPPRAGAAFDKRAASKHFLYWCARLAGDVNAVGAARKRRVVAQRLEDATRFWRAVQRAGVGLDPRSQPTHLAVWTQVAS